MIVEINRIEGPDPLIGSMSVNGKVIGFTLERPYLNNERNVSAIPIGFYLCTLIYSPKFGKCYEVKNVYGRTNILIHKGNVLSDSSGCILIGKSVGFLNKERAVLSSREAFTEFMGSLDGIEEFKLIIK